MATLVSNEKYSLYFQKVNLLYKKPELRASIEVIFSVFTVTILIFAAIRPTLTNIASLQKKISDQEAVNTKADNKIKQLFDAEKQLTTYSSSLYLFDEAVPDLFSYSDVAKRLEYLAKTNGLTVENLGFMGFALQKSGELTTDWKTKIIKPANNSLQNQISFSVNGAPINVLNFLREVENMDRLVTLDNVSFSVQLGLTKAADTLKATGTMTAYYYSTSP